MPQFRRAPTPDVKERIRRGNAAYRARVVRALDLLDAVEASDAFRHEARP